MKKPREFWLTDNTDNSGWSVETKFNHCRHHGSCNVVHVREVVPMPSEDDVSGLAMQYCASAEYPTGHAGFIAGFKKALELMGYRK